MACQKVNPGNPLHLLKSDERAEIANKMGGRRSFSPRPLSQGERCREAETFASLMACKERLQAFASGVAYGSPPADDQQMAFVVQKRWIKRTHGQAQREPRGPEAFPHRTTNRKTKLRIRQGEHKRSKRGHCLGQGKLWSKLLLLGHVFPPQASRSPQERQIQRERVNRVVSVEMEGSVNVEQA